MIGNTKKWIGRVGAISVIAGQFLVSPTLLAAEADISEGQKIAFDRKKGNCLACHIIEVHPLLAILPPP
jgi:sulfur-oxidizing protein SoxX